MKNRPLTAAQESEAKRLEAKIRAAIDQEIASLARLLVRTSDRDLFGQTEFHLRDLLLRMGAKAYEADSSHVPMLSNPRLVIDVIRTAANAATDTQTSRRA